MPNTHSTPPLSLTIDDVGTGRPALILHGGGGPVTVAMITGHLAETMHAVTPTLPGWNGTERPDWLTGIDDLAATLLSYLEDQDLTDVLVIGSSIGGWIAAEMAVRDAAARISGLILIDAVGIEVPGQTITDFFALDARGVAEHAFHDSERFYADPATLPPAQLAMMQSNLAALRVVAGDPYMHDPALRGRLGGVSVPALVIWGDSDAIVTPDYGRAYAQSLPDARFELVSDAGHLPQIEQPAATLALIDAFAGPGQS
jgi:pimeloyl-ACP methyl ester carboxylesterase